jgi:DNA-binding HxlR family transcriptional regulator
MALPYQHDSSLCPRYHHAIELIGRRWSGAILQVMRGGVVRFSDLAAAIPGLSDRMLSERLKELEAELLVERRVIPETPVRVEYRLTPRGEALGTVLDALTSWAHDWLGEEEDSRPRRGGRPRSAAPSERMLPRAGSPVLESAVSCNATHPATSSSLR